MGAAAFRQIPNDFRPWEDRRDLVAPVTGGEVNNVARRAHIFEVGPCSDKYHTNPERQEDEGRVWFRRVPFLQSFHIEHVLSMK